MDDAALGDTAGRIRNPKLLITAAEAYPELERAFLSARSDITGSFLVFDPDTRLHSPEGLAVGSRWFDLIVHTLKRGVSITLTISDFDPIARATMHRATWRSLRLFQAAAEAAGPGARLNVRGARHPAETGWLARLVVSPLIMARVHRSCRWLNGLTPVARAAALRDMPGVRALVRLREDGTVRPRLWPMPRLFPGTHHQKLAVFDRRRLYIGGLDLNDRRYDDHAHRQVASQTWHDIQFLVEGAVAEDAARHLDTFLSVTAGHHPPVDTGDLLVTLSTKRHSRPWQFGPDPLVQDLFDAHCTAISRAKGLIYMESQYFRDGRLTRALCRAAQRRPDLGLILMLPGAPEELAFDGQDGLDSQMGEWHQAHALRRLQRAFGARLFIGGAAQRRTGRSRHVDGRDLLSDAPMIYVHAKLSVFDHAAIVSSANLNGRSMRWDTEAGLRLDAPEMVDHVRRRAMAHWLPKSAGDDFFDPATAVTRWRGLALANIAHRPEDRQGFIVPYNLRVAEKFGTPVPFLPSEMV